MIFRRSGVCEAGLLPSLWAVDTSVGDKFILSLSLIRRFSTSTVFSPVSAAGTWSPEITRQPRHSYASVSSIFSSSFETTDRSCWLSSFIFKISASFSSRELVNSSLSSANCCWNSLRTLAISSFIMDSSSAIESLGAMLS